MIGNYIDYCIRIFQIKMYLSISQEHRAATKENVERKQARGVGEEDDDEEAPAPVSDDDDEEDVPYNPKNLPLGWDGKVNYTILYSTLTIRQ